MHIFRTVSMERMNTPKKVLCIADAPGPAEFLAPVIPYMVREAVVRVVAVGTARSVLKAFDPVICDDESQVSRIFMEFKPDLIVSAISSLAHGPYVNNAFIKLAHEQGVPVISLQDYWGNHRWPQNKEIVPFLSAVCVPDQLAESLWKEDGFKGVIAVTGNPAWDRFSDFDLERERHLMRARLNLASEDHVILFAGQGTRHHLEADRATFLYVTTAIRELQKEFPTTKLIVRAHPRAAESEYYKEYARGIEMIDTAFAEFSEEVLPAADIAVSMFSTNLIHACYMRIPAVSVLLPEQGRALLRGVGLDDFPPTTMGASAGIYEENPQELVDVIKKLYTNQEYRLHMRDSQQRHFVTDGQAVNRVVKQIQAFL